MLSIVYLSSTPSEALCWDRCLGEYQIFEAFTIAEAIWLCTQCCTSFLVISAGFQDCAELSQLEQQYSTIRLVSTSPTPELFKGFAKSI